ncbi:uncharacterized protein [Ranitomeya imitator]|uniref:uncharacterized protein n=1 Tax=Ranitomeya imitator TaxID=111125 RepID=UPI0037E88828
MSDISSPADAVTVMDIPVCTEVTESADAATKPKRALHPSTEAVESYIYTKGEYESNLCELWERVSQCISAFPHGDDTAELTAFINRLSAKQESYERLLTKYITFLKSSNVPDASLTLAQIEELSQQRQGSVENTKVKADLRIVHLQETRSHRSAASRHITRSARSLRSCRTTSSRRSVLSDQLIQAQIAAADLEVRSAFSKKEAEAEAKQAQAEAQAKQAKADALLKILHTEKERAAAFAKVKVLEQALRQCTNTDCFLPTEEVSPTDRTAEYVLNQSAFMPPNSDLMQPPKPDVTVPQTLAPPQIQSLNVPTHQQISPAADHKVNTSAPPQFKLQPPVTTEVKPQLNPYATSFHPGTAQPYTPNDLPVREGLQVSAATRNERSDLSDFARYMIRRELIKVSLSKFDDCPENFRAWKSTFKAAIADLSLTAKEELDLLISWLGPESTNRIKPLRSVHMENPATGLAAAWKRLEESYGSSEVIERALLDRLKNFPRIQMRETRKLQDLSDLLTELEFAKADPRLTGLRYLDSALGVNPIVAKLPHGIQERWTIQGSKYKEDYGVSFPPFSYLCRFVQNQARVRNDPSFVYTDPDVSMPPSAAKRYDNTTPKHREIRRTVSVKKTDIPSATPPPATSVLPAPREKDPNRECPLHGKSHSLHHCRGFKAMALRERRELLKKHRICYRCCASTNHIAKDCTGEVKCAECSSNRHVTAMHLALAPGIAQHTPAPSPVPVQGGEGEGPVAAKATVSSSCTEVCGEGSGPKCCAKICLASVYPEGKPEGAVRMYGMLDEQSNRSLAKPKFFDIFGIKTPATPYTLRTCSGLVDTTGRRASGYMISPIKGTKSFPLPALIECNDMPDERDEIPTPEAACHHPHLRHLASEIPPMDMNAEILILLGRDVLRMHKVRQQCNGPDNAPYAQRLDLGWVIVGDVCLDRMHHADCVSSFKTYVLSNGRPTCFRPCPCHYQVKEGPSDIVRIPDVIPTPYDDSFGGQVFRTTHDDNKIAPSVEDEEFVNIMDSGFVKDKTSHWVAPLPFKLTRAKLPSNREQALSRLNSLQRTLSNKPQMKEHFVTFMGRIFGNNHAESAPPLQAYEECWYLPFFGVYHPRKPNQIRVVFDSSAKHLGTSLNDVLLTGPNLTNNLVGVLLRFRKERVAITADIEQMFHCFIVQEDHRNFLRFLWHRDNDTSKEVIEYRMRVHVFGNSPSPAVATYGLRRTASEGGADAQRFVERDFYVDDALKSLPTEGEAIDLLKRTQSMLSKACLRLHKIASNSAEVMKAFQPNDHAPGFKDLNLGSDLPPVQMSLGLKWDLSTDSFGFQVSCANKSFTKRGVLSVVNSLYDPMGFVAPITIRGKFLLRQLSETVKDWDEPLPDNKLKKWETWKQSLQALEGVNVLRRYVPIPLASSKRSEIHVFSDASTEAIAAVAYLRITDSSDRNHVGFLFGKAKLAPKPDHTIPRLELCGAVLAVEMADFVQQELDVNVNNVKFYTDSKVVLGYIHNQTKRFYVYVHNRVTRIRKSSKPEQWNYVSSELNPADLATRAISASALVKSAWLTGPSFLLDKEEESTQDNFFSLQNPNSDPEIHQEVKAYKTRAGQDRQHFEYFSSWTRLVRAIASFYRPRISNYINPSHPVNTKVRRHTQPSCWPI